MQPYVVTVAANPTKLSVNDNVERTNESHFKIKCEIQDKVGFDHVACLYNDSYSYEIYIEYSPALRAAHTYRTYVLYVHTKLQKQNKKMKKKKRIKRYPHRSYGNNSYMPSRISIELYSYVTHTARLRIPVAVLCTSIGRSVHLHFPYPPFCSIWPLRIAMKWTPNSHIVLNNSI